MTRPRAVLFDLGQVLVAFDWRPALATLAERSPTASAEDLQSWFLGPSGPHDAYCTGRMDDASLLQAMHARFDPDHRMDDAWLVERWNGIFTEIEGAMELVEALRPQCRLGLVSNTNALHFEHLDRWLGLRSRFHAVSPSHEVGALKPDPVIWQHALRALDVSAHETFFTDDIEAYVETARALGMRARRHDSIAGLTVALRAMGFILPDASAD